MSLESAQQFVSKMRDNVSFREKTRSAAARQQLTDYLVAHDMEFDINDLACAMAACMDEMASM